MQKFLDADSIRKLDQYTIEENEISSIQLMEKAANQFCKWFKNYTINTNPTVFILCGPGNNGGDGLAISRILDSSYYVNTFLMASDHYSKDNLLNQESLKKINSINDLKEFRANLKNADIIIDCLFGFGLNRPLEGAYLELIQNLNKSGKKIIAVDIPSGIFIDKSSVQNTSVQADITISFQLPKLAFMFPENDDFIGKWYCKDIGLSKKFIEDHPSKYYLVDLQMISSIYKPRKKFSHKGSYGHHLVVAGSYGKIGAALLCGNASLRSGAGLLTMHLPKTAYNIVQSSFPEAMLSIDKHERVITEIPESGNYSSISIGCGIGTNKLTFDAIIE
ncbi:MAG: NAD(P)H-hydrate epimerase, partial [Bacteroidota bacterium]